MSLYDYADWIARDAAEDDRQYLLERADRIAEYGPSSPTGALAGAARGAGDSSSQPAPRIPA
jgi:hypothetical protein